MIKLFKFFYLIILVFLLFPAKTNASTSSGFDCPAGKPDGVGYTRGEKEGGWDGWGFMEWNGTIWHPGEDWNRGAGETDYGDPLYAISEGQVVAAKDFGGTWGKIVLIEHNLPDGSKVWAQYAHLSEIDVVLNQMVMRGVNIGKIGNANGQWASHLHFEIRKTLLKGDYWPSGLSKEAILAKYYSPTDFINSHRPVKGSTLTASSTEPNKVALSWTKSESNQFARYELYRATVQNGTEDPNNRTLVTKVEDQNTLAYTDKNVSGGNTYYYRLYTYFKSDLWAKSDEVSLALQRVIIPITNVKGSDQTHPVIDNGKVYWEDLRSENNQCPQKLYWYDIASGQSGSTLVGDIINGLQRPLMPGANGNRVVFQANDRLGSGSNIYMHDFNTGSTIPITTYSGEQMSPAISPDGVVVWSDIRKYGDMDLYYLDIRNARGEVPFVIQPGNQRSPRIWGNKVVWKDSRTNSNHDLYLKEIGSDSETLLARDAGIGPPDIWENYVVWENRGKVSFMDLNTRQTKTITEKLGGNPRMRDGKIVYTLSGEKDASGNTVLYNHVYDIKTGQDTKIDFPISYSSFPAVSGNYVVFDNSEKKTFPDMEIYLTQI